MSNSAFLQYNIQYNSTLLSRKREICVQRSIKRKKVIKYNRDKKNNNKYLKHPNYLPTKSILLMVVIKISHVIKYRYKCTYISDYI